MRTYYPGETRTKSDWAKGGYTIQPIDDDYLDTFLETIEAFVMANGRIPTVPEIGQMVPDSLVAPAAIALLDRGDLDPDAWPVQELESAPGALLWDPEGAAPNRPDPGITRLLRGDDSPVDPETTVTWQAYFDRTVSDVGIEDFALVETGVEDSSIVSVAGSEEVWTITVAVGQLTGAQDGSVRLNAVGQDIYDELGRHTNMVLTGEVYVVTYTPEP